MQTTNFFNAERHRCWCSRPRANWHSKYKRCGAQRRKWFCLLYPLLHLFIIFFAPFHVWLVCSITNPTLTHIHTHTRTCMCLCIQGRFGSGRLHECAVSRQHRWAEHWRGHPQAGVWAGNCNEISWIIYIAHVTILISLCSTRMACFLVSPFVFSLSSFSSPSKLRSTSCLVRLAACSIWSVGATCARAALRCWFLMRQTKCLIKVGVNVNVIMTLGGGL